PDGRLLAFSQRDGASQAFAVHTISVEDGAIRRLTAPPDTIWGDVDPSFSPDGRWIVFVRNRSDLAGDLYLAPSAGGEPRLLTESAGDIAGNAWMPDSKE